MLVAYSNPQKVRFAIFCHSPDQLKYQDAKTAWHRIFQPDSHAAPEEGPERGEGAQTVSQPEKPDKSHRRQIQAGSRNSTKTRKLDDQTVPESGDTKEASRQSGTTGKRKAGKEQGI